MERTVDGTVGEHGSPSHSPVEPWIPSMPLDRSSFRVFEPACNKLVPTTPSASPPTGPPVEGLYGIRSPASISAPLLAVED